MFDKNKKKFTRGKKDQAPRDEFDQRIIDLARVTRVMAGGKRMRFRACVVVGDHKGQLGYGVAKGKDVTIAINKAVNKAKKALITVNSVDGTIPHQVKVKFKAAKVILRPAPVGTGIIAGGAVRSLLELSGIQNISAKILGTNNKVSNVKATFIALESMLDKTRPVKEEKKVEEPSVASTSTKDTEDRKAVDGEEKTKTVAPAPKEEEVKKPFVASTSAKASADRKAVDGLEIKAAVLEKEETKAESKEVKKDDK